MSAFMTQRRVQWRDTDAAGIMHFSAYFTYMEEAEHELLRSVGLSVRSPPGGEQLAWPRVAARCQFRRPVRFEDVVDIAVRVERLGQTSVTYGFRFHHQAQEIAIGSMTTVCCCVDQDPPQPVPIPAAFADKLRPFVEQP